MLLVDLDPQGGLTISLGVDPAQLDDDGTTMYQVLIDPQRDLASILIEPYPGIHLAPATLDLSAAEIELMGELAREYVLKGKLAPFKDRFDYIIIDCAPWLGVLTINALAAADGVLIPVECEYLAFRGMQMLMKHVHKAQEKINSSLKILGIVPTMLDVRMRHSTEIYEEIKATYPQYLIDIPVRTRSSLKDALAAGQPITAYDSRGDGADAYRRIAEVISNGS